MTYADGTIERFATARATIGTAHNSWEAGLKDDGDKVGLSLRAYEGIAKTIEDLKGEPVTRQKQFVQQTRAKAGRMRLRAASEMRTAARLLSEDATVLEAGGTAFGGHRQDAEKALATARDYLSSAMVIEELCSDIEAFDLLSRPLD